jgi:hypothetical protein
MTAEPILPEIPETIRKKQFHHSGKWESGSLPKLIGYGLAFAVMAGAAAQFVGLLFPMLLPAMDGIAGSMLNRISEYPRGGGIPVLFWGCCFGLLFVLLTLGVYFGLPAILGTVVGIRIGDLAIKYKNRSPTLVGMVGLLGGMFGYATSFVLRYSIRKMPDTIFSLFSADIVRQKWQPASSYFSALNTSPEQSRLNAIANGIPWWIYVLLAIDALIVLTFSYLSSYDRINKRPFCEKCHEWFTEWRQVSISIDRLPSLFRAIEGGSVAELNGITTVSSFPKAVLKFERCNACLMEDYQLTIVVKWKEIVNQKPKLREKQWFRVMAPADVALKLAAT